jgi:hypothetical protein
MTALTRTATKNEIATFVAETSGVELARELSSANCDIALALGLRWAERKLKVDLNAPSDSALKYASNRFGRHDADTFHAGRSARVHDAPINIGIGRQWGGNVEIYVANTLFDRVGGNVVWHSLRANVPAAKCRTILDAAKMVERVVLAAAAGAGGPKLLAA